MSERIQAHVPELTQAEWLTFKDLVHRATGIALSPAKKQLLVSRLMRRLKALRLSSFTEYYDRIVNDLAGGELQTLVNSITTNKTEFFREPHHFELLESWLQSADPGVRAARLRGLRIWCAAASTGEEPYTIAAVVRSVLSHSEWARTSIFATDVDTNALQAAKAGRYKAYAVENVSEYWQERLFTNPARSGRDEYAVRSDLKERVHFGQLNLAKGGWRIPSPLDVVFCRNVLIYFDKPTQLDVVSRACRLLAPHGLLFLGHSEGLTGFELQLEPLAHTAYRARSCHSSPAAGSAPRLRAVTLSDAAPSRPRPFTIGKRGRVRLLLKSGVLVALFSPAVQQTCIAYLKEGSTAEHVLHLRAVLDSMVHSLRRAGATDGGVQAKTVASNWGGTGQQQQGTCELQTVVHGWLQDAGIALVAQREVPARTELRIDLQTGRIQIRAASCRSDSADSDGSRTVGSGTT